MEALSLHFTPVVFPPPGKRLDIGAHENLLTRLGLWDFVNLDFGEIIREDLIKELVLSCKHRSTRSKRCQVSGATIYVNRTALANALRLPLKRVAEGGRFLVSKEEGLFLEELIWGLMILRDEGEDASLMSNHYMSGFAEVLRESKFESADWAGLVWFMAQREVSRGQDLANCYYAPHLQLLLKRQKPEWFGDHGGLSVRLESGQTQSILTKCGKRKREFFDVDDDEGKRLMKLDLAGRELFLDKDDGEGKMLRKLDLAGRELGGDALVNEGGNMDALVNEGGNMDALVNEGGNLEALCQSDMVDLLENGKKLLLDLQVNSNTAIHSSDCDISVTKPGYSESHSYSPPESGVETAEPKGAHLNDYDIFERMKSMQVAQGRFQSAHVKERRNEGVMNLDGGGWKMGRCQKENDVIECKKIEVGCGASGEAHQSDMIEGGATGAESEVNFGRETGIVEEKAKGSAVESNVGDSLDEVPCVKEDKMEGKANEAECVTSTLNTLEMQSDREGDVMQNGLNMGAALEMHCMNEDDVMQDEADEGVYETNIDNALKEHGREEESMTSVDLVVKKDSSTDGLDQQERENQRQRVDIIESEYKHEMNVDSISYVAGDKMDCYEVDLHCMKDNAGRDLESVAIVDLLKAQEAHGKVVKKDLSTDGLDWHIIENRQNEVDIIENQYKPELEFKSATEMPGDSIVDVAGDVMDSCEVDLNCMEDNAGREVEFMSFVDLLRAQEALGNGVKNEAYHEDLDTQKIDEHWIQQKKIQIIDEHWVQQNLADEAVSETSTGIALEMHCMKEDDAMPDETSKEMAQKVHCMKENALNVHCMKENYVVPDEPSEAHAGDSLIVPCKARGEFVEGTGNETAFEANAGNSLNVHCKSENDVMGGEAKAVCKADILISHEVHSGKDDDMEEENEAEFAAEKSRGSMADFSGVERECQEVDMNCMAYYTGKELESVASADLLVAQEAHDEVAKKDSSTGTGFIIEHQALQNVANNVVCKTGTGIALEVPCMKEDDAMPDEISTENALMVHSMEGNYVAPDEPSKVHFDGSFIVPCKARGEYVDDTGNETAFEANAGDSLKLHRNSENDVRGGEAKAVCEADILISHEVHSEKDDDMEEEENEAEFEANVSKKSVNVHCEKKDMVLPLKEQEAAFEANDGNSLGVCRFNEDAMKYKENEANTSDSLTLEVNTAQDCCQPELEFTNEAVKSREPEFSGDEMERQEVYTGKEVIDEPYDLEMDFCGAELSLMQSNKEGNATGTLVNQACEGNTSNLLGHKEQMLHKFQLVQIDVSSDSSDDEKCQNACGHFESGEGNGMKGQFPFETDTPWCSFGMTAQYGHEEDTANRLGIGTSNGHVEKSMDLDYCVEIANIWVARLIDSAKGKVEESNNSNVMLQKKVEEQNELIQKYELMLQKERQENRQYELMLHKEQQEKQTSDRRYEHELNLLNNALQDYSKSIKQVNTSFAKYRERSQLPEGYMAHPNGGGRVVLISEWEQEQQNKSLLAIKATMEKFEEQWKKNLEEQLGIMGAYNDRLGDLEHAVNTMKP